MNFTMAYLNAFAPELYGRHRVWMRQRTTSFQLALMLLASLLFALERHDLRGALRVEKGEHAMAERQERGEMVAVRLAPHPRSGRGLPRGVENGVGAVGGQVRPGPPAPLPQPDVYRRVLALPHARVPRHDARSARDEARRHRGSVFRLPRLSKPRRPLPGHFAPSDLRVDISGVGIGAGAADGAHRFQENHRARLLAHRRRGGLDETHVRGEPRGGCRRDHRVRRRGRSASRTRGRGNEERGGARNRTRRDGGGSANGGGGRRRTRGQPPRHRWRHRAA